MEGSPRAARGQGPAEEALCLPAAGPELLAASRGMQAVRGRRLPCPGAAWEGNLNLHHWVSRSVFTQKSRARRTGLYLFFCKSNQL